VHFTLTPRGSTTLRDGLFQQFISLLNSAQETGLLYEFILPIFKQMRKLGLTEKQKSNIQRYINHLKSMSESVQMRVLYFESRPEELFTEQNIEIDKWYRQLAVSEQRIEQVMKTYEHIRQCLKKEACYLFTGQLGHVEDGELPSHWDLMIYGSVTNGLCTEQESDLDLTLVVNSFTLRHDVLLRRVKTILEKHQRYAMQEPI
jgi:hypothetical protein